MGVDVRQVAEAQHGVIARRQLRDLGVTDKVIDGWRGSGRLIDVLPAVYVLGHRPPSVLADLTAALLYCGNGAVLGEQASLVVWGLAESAREVVVWTPRRSRGAGFVRPREGGVEQMVRRDGFPITSIPRTLADLSGPIDVLLHEALARRLTTREECDLFLAAHPRRSGNAKLRAALSEPDFRSPTERRLSRAIKRKGMPEPATNQKLHGFRPDLYWPPLDLVIELDGGGHRSPHQQRIDEAMDRTLNARGIIVLRFDNDAPAALAALRDAVSRPRG